MFCTRARSCARADDAKLCAVRMRNAKLGNHLNFFFVCLLTDIQKTFTETERLPFRYVKEHLPKQCLLSDEISY